MRGIPKILGKIILAAGFSLAVVANQYAFAMGSCDSKDNPLAKFVDKEQGDPCPANANARKDKKGGDYFNGEYYGGARSICKSAYKDLAKASKEYASKKTQMCRSLASSIKNCDGMASGQKDYTLCMASAYKEAAASEAELAKFLNEKIGLAKQLQDAAANLAKEYEQDKVVMDTAKENAEKLKNDALKKMAAANAEMVSDPSKAVEEYDSASRIFQEQNQAIESGKAVTRGRITTNSSGEITAEEGGGSTISGADSYLDKVDTLVNEQKSATANARSFASSATGVKAQHATSAKQYNEMATTLQTKANSLGTIDDSANKGGARSNLSGGLQDTKGGLASRTNSAGASTMSNGTGGGSSDNAAGGTGVAENFSSGATTESTGGGSDGGSGGGPGGAMGALGGMAGAMGGGGKDSGAGGMDSVGSSGSSTTASSNFNTSSGAAGSSQNGGVSINAKGGKGGDKNDGFVAGNGDLPSGNGAEFAIDENSSARSTTASKSTGRSLASSFSSGSSQGGGSMGKGSSSSGNAAASLNDMSGNQFKAVGSLGSEVVDMSASSDGSAAPLESLDNLFGEESGKGKVGENTIRSVMQPFGEGSGSSASETESQGALSVASDTSLFDRTRGAHERALKRGLISLVHKKL